jgi:nitroimidazol reductase NimA-like FMN-containing flavoprotein (pyridoxamine 5'-phosphate oxidase superfamily)
MKMKSGPEACAFTTKYRSVMAWGKASIPEEPEEKAFGMNILMRHCT